MPMHHVQLHAQNSPHKSGERGGAGAAIASVTREA
jgi:hypothetical protein